MRVLVVEDSRRLAGIIKRGLLEEGYAVDNAYDGEEAEYMAETTPFDIIILDIMLPKKDGLAVCRDLRAKAVSTPILMLTAKDSVEDRVTGLDCGADDYLVKPFAFSELLARIRALLRREVLPKTQKFQVGDLSLDPQSREVWRDGEPPRANSQGIRHPRILHAPPERRGDEDHAREASGITSSTGCRTSSTSTCGASARRSTGTDRPA